MLLYVDEDPYAKWSMIGSLVSAGATLLGVILAGFAGYVAYRLFKVESERDRQAVALLLRQQAAAIGFWHDDEGVWLLSNHSALPIYDIFVGTVEHKLKDNVIEIDKVDFTVAEPTKEAFRGHLPPGESAGFQLDPEAQHVCVVFRDNAGRRWFRQRWRLRQFSELDEMGLTLYAATTRARFAAKPRLAGEDSEPQATESEVF